MIRKLRTRRNDQQWMLDLALNMRGRVQNFERDGDYALRSRDRSVPDGAAPDLLRRPPGQSSKRRDLKSGTTYLLTYRLRRGFWPFHPVPARSFRPI